MLGATLLASCSGEMRLSDTDLPESDAREMSEEGIGSTVKKIAKFLNN